MLGFSAIAPWVALFFLCVPRMGPPVVNGQFLGVRHVDECPKRPLPIDTHAFKHIVMTFACARLVYEGVAGTGTAIVPRLDEVIVDLSVWALCVCPVNIKARGIRLCTSAPSEVNVAIII